MKQFHKGPEQIKQRVWDGIVESCNLLYGMRRTAEALRVEWKALSKEVQLYLIERKAAQNKPISWLKDVYMVEITMKLYCAQARRKGSNEHFIYTIAFNYTNSAHCLRDNLEFSGPGEELKNMTDSAMGCADCSDRGEGTGMETTVKRSRGLRTEKRVLKKEKGDGEVTETLREVRAEMSNNNEVICIVGEKQA